MRRELEAALPDAAIRVIEKETKEIRRLTDIVNESVSIRMKDGTVFSDLNLDSFDLEALAMRLPAECLRLQGAINRYNIHNTFEDIELEANITDVLCRLEKKGTADERKKKAEAEFITEKEKIAVYKQIVRGLQAYIERADKTYEGVKKVLDYRAKEGWFDRKGPN